MADDLLRAALKPFAFLNEPERFLSTDGGCTTVILDDADVQRARHAYAAAQADPPVPLAWSYELASARSPADGSYHAWSQHITAHKPEVPEGSIRNLVPLYAVPLLPTDPQVLIAVLEACREKFDFYAQEHRKKAAAFRADSDAPGYVGDQARALENALASDQKAEANERMALLISEALRSWEHPTPLVDLVRRFAAALLAKLQAAEAKYKWRDNWLEDDWQDTLIRHLYEHVEKGDPRDVAAYCAFAWHHGWSVSHKPAARIQLPDGSVAEVRDTGAGEYEIWLLDPNKHSAYLATAKSVTTAVASIMGPMWAAALDRADSKEPA